MTAPALARLLALLESAVETVVSAAVDAITAAWVEAGE